MAEIALNCDMRTCAACLGSVPRSREAESLRRISNDLRSAGDISLVRLSEHGVTQQAITLAEELWMIGLQLDGHMGVAYPAPPPQETPDAQA